ncbi:protein lava lamp-like [Pomacea canaliculata]|uniref:protein lava lamp-like n=1 Tax=Pomacea canaliculata TaxID=400727 RepID=UPI000D734C5C|nr:protein lava lamp-like [Pomacea canaliculata]
MKRMLKCSKKKVSKLQMLVAALKEEDSNKQQNIHRFNGDILNMKKYMLTMEETLMASISRLQEDIDTVESVKDENSKLQMDVAALKEQLSSIQQSSILSKDISSIQKDMASLQEKQIGDNTMLQKDIATIREISSQHGREMKKFQCDFINLVKDLKSFKEKSCYMVAFHAELKQTMETNWEWKPIILEADNCNLGQAYDTKTGVFTAPVAGTYFFMARTVRNEGSGYCSLAISVERCKTTSSLSHYGKLQAGVGCTVHVVQRLTPGQTVSLMGYGRAKLPGCATCFSGMLVRPDIELAQS